MFINNTTKKSSQSAAQKDCMCTLFQDNRIGTRKQWKEGKESVRSYNNTPRSQLNIAKASEESKKISLSSFVKEKKEKECRDREINVRSNYQKQEIVGYENIQQRNYLNNRSFIPGKNTQHELRVGQKYTPQILSAVQSLAYLQPIIVPRPSIYHRKPVQQSIHQSFQQVHTQPPHFYHNHGQFYSNRSHTDLHSVEKQLFNKNIIQTSSFIKHSTPRLSLSQKYDIKISQPIKQQLEVHQTQAIIQSKMSKEGGFSTQSTNINKQSKNFSYLKQSLYKYSPYREPSNNSNKDQFVPFISQIQPINGITPNLPYLNKFKSIESINNTHHDFDSLNASIVLQKPYKFARLELPHGQKRMSPYQHEKHGSPKQDQISIEIQKQKWRQFQDYLPQIDQSNEQQQYF